MTNTKLKRWPRLQRPPTAVPGLTNAPSLALLSVPVSSLADDRSENIPARSSLCRRSRQSAHWSEWKRRKKRAHQTPEASPCVSEAAKKTTTYCMETNLQSFIGVWKQSAAPPSYFGAFPVPAACKRGLTHICSLTPILTEKSQKI